MSGGHYDYIYFKLDELADFIEKDFVNDGKYMTEDWSADYNSYFEERPTIEQDRLFDANIEQKQIILNEVKSLIKDLKTCAKRAKELEWFMSGDTGPESYLERLQKIKNI